MLLPLHQNVILFGDGEKICRALETETVRLLTVIGVCQDSFFEDREIPGNPLKIEVKELKDHPEAIVVVADDEMAHTTQAYFEGFGIRYAMLSELSVQMPEPEPEPEPEPVAVAEPAPVEEVAVEEPIVQEPVAEAPVAEAEAVEEVPAVEAEPTVAEAPAAEASLTQEQFEELKAKVEGCCEEILRAVRNTKSKDTSIYNMNKELQKFKDGYFLQITNPLITDLIALREDCKKCAEDIDKYNLTAEKQKDYIQCTVEQIEDMLTNHDVSVKDGVHLFHGVAFYPSAENIRPLQQGFDAAEEEACAAEEAWQPLTVQAPTLQGVCDFLAEAQQRVEALLAQTEQLVQTVTRQTEENKKQQKVCDGLLLTPLFVKIIQLSDFFEKRMQALEAAPEAEEAASIYRAAYAFAVDYLETLLLQLGVKIKSNLDDTFEPKYHRMLKMTKLAPEEAEKDKKIAQFCTDCYLTDEKVIYPAKVIVYRL